MRRFVTLLCILLNVSLTLMPFNNIHAHVSTGDQDQPDVHTGHSHDYVHTHQYTHSHDGTVAPHVHDADHGHTHGTSHAHGGDGVGGAGDNTESGEVDQIVDLEPTLTHQKDSGTASVLLSIYWLPLAYVMAVIPAGASVCISLLRPPRSSPRPLSHRGHWRPPLRGPPATAIQVLC